MIAQNEAITLDQITQYKAKELVWLGNHQMTAQGAATIVANKLFALSGSEGVLTNGVRAESGLSRLMNAALRKAAKAGRCDTKARIEEKPLDKGSMYYPYWK